MKKIIFSTSGKGCWTNVKGKVQIKRIYLESVYNELQVHFYASSWNTSKKGLIYTDPLWLSNLKSHLVKIGFSKSAVSSIDYSEQGMQGKNYVSLDVGSGFVKEWKQKNLLAVLS